LKFITSYASKIEEGLSQIPFPAQPVSLYEPQKYILKSGGKRIRPILTLISCGLCGGDPEKSMPAALAVELLHNFTLIHDDIMDQAESRRGNPSIHVEWDEPTAILAGDSMFTIAMLQLQNLDHEIDHKAVSGVFLESVKTVCEGQAFDMEFESRLDVTVQEYLAMIEGKTGALISAAMRMGGMAAGADSGKLQMLNEIGRSLGLAFQIQDDWLDVVADPDKFGKRQAGDIYEGKKTFLLLTALERCNDLEKEELLGFLENKPLTDRQVNYIIRLFNRYKVLDEIREEYLRQYKKAEIALNRFDDSDFKQDLQQLINYLKNREI
jgi:geranylgeranyl diphosphate synthase, type II